MTSTLREDRVRIFIRIFGGLGEGEIWTFSGLFACRVEILGDCAYAVFGLLRSARVEFLTIFGLVRFVGT